MILTLTPNPCVDKTIFLDEITIGTFMRAPRYSCIAGGKGVNVARAVHAMGGDAIAMTVVGGHTGRHVVEMIESDGVICEPVFVDSPTRTITTVLEEPIHRQTAFFEPGSRVLPVEMNRIIHRFSEVAARANVVVFSGTVPDPAISEIFATLIPVARSHGATVILDSHGREFELGLQAVPDLIKPNAEEAAELVGFALDSDEARARALDHFHAMGVQTVVLSLGSEGALVSGEGRRFHVKPPAITEVNPVGSGDALVGGFALGMDRNESIEAMARLGVAMGTANAMSWDIGHFTPEEVDGLLQQVFVTAL